MYILQYISENSVYCFFFYSTQEVAEGLLELVTDDTKNGAILKMSKLTGKDYVVLECKKMET